jgi:hypothetical protein
MENNKLELCQVMSDWFWDTRIDIKSGVANQDRIDFYNQYQPLWEDKVDDFLDEPNTFTDQDQENVYELLYLEAYIAGVLY